MSDLATPELQRLLTAEELDNLCTRLGPPLRAALAIEDARGNRLVGGPIGVTAVTRDLRCAGHVVGRVVATGPGAEAAAAAVVSAIELAAGHAWRAARLGDPGDRARAAFLAMMSHELRTPLTSVMGYAELLLEGLAGPINDEQREHLQTILGKSEQLLGVIGALLDVARAASGGPIERALVPLQVLVEEVVGRAGEAAQRRGLRLHIAAAPLAVQGDRRQLRQLIANLVDNAMKFSHDGGDIEIRVERDVDAARIVVRDAGVGIAADAIDRVFEPFFQADSSSTRAHGGAGIGLTVARAFVEAHGGRLWVESNAGAGATFIAALPLASAEAGRADLR